MADNNNDESVVSVASVGSGLAAGAVAGYVANETVGRMLVKEVLAEKGDAVVGSFTAKVRGIREQAKQGIVDAAQKRSQEIVAKGQEAVAAEEARVQAAIKAAGSETKYIEQEAAKMQKIILRNTTQAVGKELGFFGNLSGLGKTGVVGAAVLAAVGATVGAGTYIKGKHTQALAARAAANDQNMSQNRA